MRLFCFINWFEHHLGLSSRYEDNAASSTHSARRIHICYRGITMTESRNVSDITSHGTASKDLWFLLILHIGTVLRIYTRSIRNVTPLVEWKLPYNA